MRNLKLALTALFVLLVTTATMLGAKNVKLPRVEILGTQYYVYESKKGETLYGIARERGWNDAELQRLNPDVISPLKKGVKIYYPVHPDFKNVATKIAKDNKAKPRETDVRHTVRRGENVYSIANLYGVSTDVIYRLNPKSKNGVSAGDVLLLYKAPKSSTALTSKEKSSASTSSTDDKAGFYTIQDQDSPRSVAENHHVSVGAIMKENPGLSVDDFKAGSVIKLPEAGSGIVMRDTLVEEPVLNNFDTHKVQKNETWNSIARQENVDVQLLKEANPGVTKLKNKQTIAVPRVSSSSAERTVEVTDPRELSQQGVQQIYEDVHNLPENRQLSLVKVAVVTESATSRKDMEYIRGFLTGLDRLKSEDYKIEFKVINGTSGSEEIRNQLEAFRPTVMFSLNDKNLPAYLAKYAEENRVPVVNTFDIRSEEYTTNPYVIQLLTPSEYFNSNTAAEVHRRYGDYHMVYAGEKESDDQLAQALKNEWGTKIRILALDEVSNYPVSENGKYLIYGFPTKRDEVKTLLNAVIELQQNNPMAEIVLLGRPNWVLYDEALSKQLHDANAIIPSRFYIDKDSREARRFEMEFKSLFDRVPVKSVPLYAGMGYDTSLYFIPALVKANGDFNRLPASTDTMQSEIDLTRTSNWGGFLNTPTYLVRFTPYGSVEKTVVK